MFDVERSAHDRITVNDETIGQRWTFVVVDAAEGRSLVPHDAQVPAVGQVDNERLARAKTFADIEAWKRGIID